MYRRRRDPSCRALLSCVFAFAALFCAVPPVASGIDIVLDYSLDDNNWGWFSGTPEGLARRASLDAAAGFLSEIITTDDWAALPSLNETFSMTDIFQSTIVGPSGQTLTGSPDSDGQGFAYTVPTSNRSSVGVNEYIIYVGALAFDSGTSSHAKGGWDSSDRRNAAGFAGTEFNTWGGRIYFDLSDTWYTGQNPGIDPTDDYGFQDPDKTPVFDLTTDNWDYSSASHTWKGFDLESVDPSADGKLDLYATAVHELIHALGSTSSNIPTYVGLDASGDLIGANVVAINGGPVPASGGHFATDVQSIVWNSGDIVSEVTLDPNSLRSVRKYLTELDAALLRDLGYTVASDLAVLGDYNGDGLVNAADYTVWRDTEGSTTQLAADGNGSGTIDEADYTVWQDAFVGQALANASTNTIPEPATFVGLLTVLLAVVLFREEKHEKIRAHHDLK